MSLDPTPDAATLLRLKAEREGRASVEPVRHSRIPNALPQVAITLRLPWSCLVSDNDKHVAFLRAGKPAIKITRAYAEAKERIAQIAREAVGDATPFACPLAFTARVWYPNNHPRDLTNWCKLVQDALNGVVYDDDRWLRDVRWLHAGVDVDAPHALITVCPTIPVTVTP